MLYINNFLNGHNKKYSIQIKPEMHVSLTSDTISSIIFTITSRSLIEAKWLGAMQFISTQTTLKHFMRIKADY